MRRRKTHEEYIEEVYNVDPNINVVGVYSGNHIKISHKCMIDGFCWDASPANILAGKGCPECKRTKLQNSKLKLHEKYVEEAKQVNPNIVVLGKYVGNRTPILHKCTIDGYVWNASPGNILKGCGCPKCGIESRKILRTKSHNDYIAEVFNINPNVEVVDLYVDAETKIRHRCKIDGHEWYVLPSNILSGHGCPICNSSRGERNVTNYLDSHHIDYIPQYTFNDCKNKRLLPFDFYLPTYNVCIEYDGEQHFKPVDYFGGQDGLLQRQHNDNIKTIYCIMNNIELLRIRYDEDIVNVLDNFFNNTKLIKEVI